MSDDKDNCEDEGVKVDDLPFYSFPRGCSYALQDREPGVLQEKVKVVRTGMVEMFTLAEQNIYAGAVLFSSAYAHITKEENLPARVGIMTGGGLLGLAVGLARGRIVRRVVFPMVGVVGGAAISYPKQAREVRDKVIQQGRINIMQAYSSISSKEAVSDISNQLLHPTIFIPLYGFIIAIVGGFVKGVVTELYEIMCELWNERWKPLLSVDKDEEDTFLDEEPKVKVVTNNDKREVIDKN